MTVKRLDRGTTSNVKRTPEGWLHLDGRLTRTGVFLYRNADGTERRELRLPEEVFHPDSMATANLVPLTNQHPDDFLTAADTRAHQVGMVGQDVRRDAQDHLVATIRVTDAAAIKDVDAGRRQLSCGYVCELEAKPGIYNGERYDVIQRGIRYNHVALVDAGRAGPTARLRMDAAEGDVIHPGASTGGTPSQERHMNAKIKLDSVDYEISEQGKQAVDRELARRDAAAATQAEELKTLKAKLDSTTAERDAAKTEADKAKKDAAEATDPKKLAAAVQARASLLSAAGKILGDDEAKKLDAADELDIRKAVVGKAYPSLKLDGKSPDYVAALYEAAVAKADAGDGDTKGSGTGNSGLEAARKAAGTGGTGTDTGRKDGTEEPAKDADEARARMIARNADGWKKPLVVTKDAPRT